MGLVELIPIAKLIGIDRLNKAMRDILETIAENKQAGKSIKRVTAGVKKTVENR